jgi:hypothetical protein
MAEQTIAPILPPESNAWWPRLRSVFQDKFTNSLIEVRGVGVGIDMDPNLTTARRYADQRDTVASAAYTQGHRGHQTRIPTPQELIKQVTGIGDVGRGR